MKKVFEENRFFPNFCAHTHTHTPSLVAPILPVSTAFAAHVPMGKRRVKHPRLPPDTACSKQLHLRCIPPSEVWAIIFGYTGQGLQADQISRFRLLSRSITAGLDEWIRLELHQGVKKDGCLRLIRDDPDDIVAPIRIHKLGLLALSKAPKEFFPTVTKLTDFYLERTTADVKDPSLISRYRHPESPSVNSIGEQVLNHLLSQLSNVTSIGESFMLRLDRVRLVDLSSMTQLTTIGDGFLCCCTLDDLLLPPSLKSIGNDFLADSTVKKVDLSHTALDTVGDYFVSSCKSDEILLPRSLTYVGANFISKSTVKRIDLSQTSLETVEAYFLCAVESSELLLPPSLKEVEIGCLYNGRITQLLLPESVEPLWCLNIGPHCTVLKTVIVRAKDSGRKRSRQPDEQ